MRYADRHPSGVEGSGGPSHRTGERSHQKARLAEGVGFEPTVGFPTLDFESSALNRTQPPFLEAGRKRPTPNVQYPTLNATGPLNRTLSVRRWALSVIFSPSSGFAPTRLENRIFRLT